jgi:hypothetical protein
MGKNILCTKQKYASDISVVTEEVKRLPVVKYISGKAAEMHNDINIICLFLPAPRLSEQFHHPLHLYLHFPKSFAEPDIRTNVVNHQVCARLEHSSQEIDYYNVM